VQNVIVIQKRSSLLRQRRIPFVGSSSWFSFIRKKFFLNRK